MNNVTVWPQLACSARLLTCGNGRIVRNNNGPRRVREHPRGVADCVGVDMTEVTPACARPTKRRPNGSTGTPTGYIAHRGKREPVCEPCMEAWRAKEAERKTNMSPVFLERERAKSAERARRRRMAASPCLAATPEHPNGQQGTLDGYLAHVAAGQWPCGECRAAADAHDFGSLCARPTAKYPQGRTGTRPGYHAHLYAGEPACVECLKGNAAAQAQRRVDEPDLSMRGHLWSKFRLSLEAYEAMLVEQGNACAICGIDAPTDIRTSRFHVDHDHGCCPGPKSCGKCIRGLLCHHCNTALGNFQDDPKRLTAAVAYLAKGRRGSYGV